MASKPKDCLNVSWNQPAEWFDEDKMYFLASPYPPGKEVSPSDKKYQFWSGLIISSTKDLGRLTFTIAEIQERFQWNNCTPKCMKSIIEIMRKSGIIVTYDDFVNAKSSGVLSWTANLVVLPVKWAFSYALPKSEYLGKYIIVDRMNVVSDLLCAKHYQTVTFTNTDNLVFMEHFHSLCSEMVTSSEDKELLLLELTRRGAIATGVTSKEMKVVKFSLNPKTKASLHLTEADYAILDVKQSIHHLENVIGKRKESLKSYFKKVKDILREKGKKEAMTVYRLYKREVTSKEREDVQLINLQQILEKIQQAETDGLVMEAYKSGLLAMKSALDELPLNKEEVEDVIDQMQDVAAELDDFQDVLSSDVATKDFDMEELEQELASLTIGSKPKETDRDDPVPTVDTVVRKRVEPVPEASHPIQELSDRKQVSQDTPEVLAKSSKERKLLIC